jgi:hypothetical protein
MAGLLKSKTLKDIVFEVGEEVKIKACRFKIVRIDSQGMLLSLLPDQGERNETKADNS